MATKGFIELLRLADRGKNRQVSLVDTEKRWSGIGFEMFGHTFLAPLGDVEEVMYTPLCTPIPNSQKWMQGVANIRGKLLSVTNLARYISEDVSPLKRTHKVMCLSHPTHYCGVVVDQVFGIQHLNTQSYFSNNDELPEYLKQFCQGHFVHQNKTWSVFLLRNLFHSQKFMNPAVSQT